MLGPFTEKVSGYLHAKRQALEEVEQLIRKHAANCDKRGKR